MGGGVLAAVSEIMLNNHFVPVRLPLDGWLPPNYSPLFHNMFLEKQLIVGWTVAKLDMPLFAPKNERW